MAAKGVKAKRDTSGPVHDCQWIVVRDREKTPKCIAQQNAFLEYYAKCGNIKMTSRRLKLDKKYHYYWLRNDPEYYEKFQQVRQIAIGDMEDEAHRRAMEGFTIPIYQKGMKVGEMTQFSDNLLMFLLKGAAPERFRDNWKGQEKAEVRSDPDLSKLTTEEIETLHAITVQLRLRSLPEARVETPRPDPDPDVFQ